MCPPDETIEDPQPDPTQQPAPTYHPSEFFDDLSDMAREQQEDKFPLAPVAVGVGAIALIAAIAG